MISIHIESSIISEICTIVVWSRSYGTPSSGKTKVTFDRPIADADVVAELAKLLHLFESELPSGVRELQGKGLSLTVSDTIKELAQDKSDKRHLWPFAKFIKTAMRSSKIITHDRDTPLKIKSEEATDLLDISLSDLWTRSYRTGIVDIQNLGLIAIGSNVVQFFQERRADSDATHARNDIISILQSKDFEQIEFPIAIKQQLSLQYIDYPLELWTSIGQSLVFMLTKQPDGFKYVSQVIEKDISAYPL